VDNPKAEPPIVHASCILVKNQIIKFWPSNVLSAEFRSSVRNGLLSIVFGAKASIPTSLIDAIQFIASKDYPDAWPTFLNDLRSKCHFEQPIHALRLFELLDAAFFFLRKGTKSDSLLVQILDLTNIFGLPLLSCISNSRDFLLSADISGSFRHHMNILYHGFSFYRSLISFDIPQLFEDRSADLFTAIIDILSSSKEKQDAPIFDKLIGSISEVLCIYSTMFEEDFENLPEISRIVLSLVAKSQDNQLESTPSLIRFISSVVNKESVKSSFRDSLPLLLQFVVLPNLSMERFDVSSFENEPLDFVRNELACILEQTSLLNSIYCLTKALAESFSEQFTQLCEKLIQSLIGQPKSDWRSKEQAIRLFSIVGILEYSNEVPLSK
jgi:hypothetical protein